MRAIIPRRQSGVGADVLRPSSEEVRYWDAVAEGWQAQRPQALWRLHSDAVNAALLARWLPTARLGSTLKTDLFDEALGDGLYPVLVDKTRCVVGIDLSVVTVRLARARYPDLRAVATHVRHLPFTDGAFDLVVSNSTLDHFKSPDHLVAALRELRRVLRVDGELLLTLDNPANPVVAARNALPFALVHRLGLVPYYVGATLGPRELRRALVRLGFDVAEVGAALHCPRVLAVAVAGLVDRYGGPRARQRLLRLLWGFERLSRSPTRFLSGHFVTVRAIRR